MPTYKISFQRHHAKSVELLSMPTLMKVNLEFGGASDQSLEMFCREHASISFPLPNLFNKRILSSYSCVFYYEEAETITHILWHIVLLRMRFEI